MPLVTVSVHQGQLDAAQKARMIELVTDAVVAGEGLGEGARPSTWVRIEEVPPGGFGVGGRPVTLDAYLAAVRARSAT